MGAWTPSSSSLLQEEIINSPEELKQPADRFCSPQRRPDSDPQPGSEPSGSTQHAAPSAIPDQRHCGRSRGDGSYLALLSEWGPRWYPLCGSAWRQPPQGHLSAPSRRPFNGRPAEARTQQQPRSRANPPALLLTRLFIIFQEAVAGRRRQPMASAVVLTAERRRPMGDEGGPRRSRAALEHDIICLHAAA